MIIAYHGGRLGNQIFQYCALRRFAAQHVLVALGFGELLNGFDGLTFGAPDVVLERLAALVRRLGRPRVERFVARGWFGSLTHTSAAADFRPLITRGRFGGAVLVSSSYFQHQSLAETAAAASLQIKPQFLAAARALLPGLAPDPDHAYFMHVRLGDYRRYPSPQFPAMLPADWYRAQIAALRAADPLAQIIVMSDEPAAARAMVHDLPAITFSSADQMTDLALMTLCRGGGILSASSFAWWGAALLRRNAPQARLIAPTSWIGHRQQRWIPSTIVTDWLEYAPVA